MKRSAYLLPGAVALVLTACNKDEVITPDPDGDGPDKGDTTTQRPVTPTSSASSVKVFEYTPAPGQFINENMDGVDTPERACAWAQERLDKNLDVSLGAFGGFIVVGFDHSIVSHDTGYDFTIGGNAFFNASTGTGGSNEPGIVYVMQDTNGNGLPDDTWYELMGSDTRSETTIHNYQVTYYRPTGDGEAVRWTDNQDGEGTVDYIAVSHKQPSYYPAWVIADTYTLSGTRLESRTDHDTVNRVWNNWAFDWGYADNMGSDRLEGEGQRNGFAIRNAVNADFQPVGLDYIDFVKVQTGVNSKAKPLGEVSTEVFHFTSLSVINTQ